jgi:hypothetical protein
MIVHPFVSHICSNQDCERGNPQKYPVCSSGICCMRTVSSEKQEYLATSTGPVSWWLAYVLYN